MGEYDEQLREAVKHFWATRRGQSARQGAGGERDRGSRSAVTGGKQMDGFVAFVRSLLMSAGVRAEEVITRSRLDLPGWFRAEKQWDLIVVRQRELLAAVEFKSQIGPSFGNNFNNRSEEAIGSATDIWAAYREGAFKPSSRPWLGYLMLLEDCPQSRQPVGVSEPHFRVFPEFKEASYKDRYEILVQKLLRDRLYDGCCFLLTRADAVESGGFTASHPELTFSKFIRPLLARVAAGAPPEA